MVTFKDSKGRTYSPRLTALAIMEFERLSGVGLFTAVFDAFAERPGEDPGSLPKHAMLRIGQKIFGNVGNIITLLYSACRTSESGGLAVAMETTAQEGQYIPIPVKVEFDDFAVCVGAEQINPALAAAMESLLEFFPTAMPKEGGDSAKTPFADFFGGMSLKPPPSPE